MESSWNKFLVEGDRLYDVLVKNFENMIDGDLVKHFDIRDGIYRCIADTKQIEETDGIEIQKQLVPWIRNELKEGRLFDKNNWKPFRNQHQLIDMHYGYKILFVYKHYYFQLGIESFCEADECKYCGHTKDIYFEEHEDNSEHFLLALYGWKNKDSDELQPSKKVSLTPDNIMPHRHWISK